jgi:hypothetical protein
MLVARIGGEGLRSTTAFFSQRRLQIGDGRARGRAEQAERGLRFHRKRNLAHAQDLRLAVEHGLAPDMQRRLGAEAEPALLLARLDQQRDQEALARRGDLGAQHRDLDRPLPSSGKERPFICASSRRLTSVKGTSIGTPILTAALLERRHDFEPRRERAVSACFRSRRCGCRPARRASA